MSLQKDLPELVEAGLIDQSTADRIQDYYLQKKGNPSNRLFVVFGVLGAILVGLGIILIVAHNWDQLPRMAKTVFAFLPLVIGQLLCAYALFKKSDSLAWRESSASFLFFALGASIALVSQVYNIPGNLSSYLLSWMLLSLPLLYVMRSSMSSLLYLLGITYYACELGYWTFQAGEPYFYWILLLLSLPHYYFLYKDRPKSNFLTFHHWMFPLSLIITLGTLSLGRWELMFVAYFSLFGVFYNLGQSPYFKKQATRNNGYSILGSFGSIVLLLIMSFSWFWEDLRHSPFSAENLLQAPELIGLFLLSLIALGLFLWNTRTQGLGSTRPVSLVFLVYIILFTLGMKYSFVVVVINLFTLLIGLLTVREGARHDRLGMLNYGLLIIAALVICRFFDTDLSFVIRGLLFVSVGVGFFVANYLMLKRRRNHE